MSSTRLRDMHHMVQIGDHLEYALFPALLGGAAEVQNGRAFTSTAVCLALVFDDGSTSLETDLCDQAGYLLNPASQRDSAALAADQWNYRTASLDSFVGHEIVAVHIAGIAPSCPDEDVWPHGWISDVRISPAPPSDPTSFSEKVDTRRGSHSSHELSRGNTVPAVAVPHGFSFAIPITDAGSRSWPYRYHSGERTELQAVGVSHLPSPWMGERGAVHIMPSAAGSSASADRAARARSFRHADEVAHPHLWSTTLDDGVTVELTATARVLVARFTVPRGGGFHIDQLDTRGNLTFHPDDPVISFSGYTDTHREDIGGNVPRAFFVIAIDCPLVSVRQGSAPAREQVSASVTTSAQSFTVRISSSFVSIEQARRTLLLEAAPVVGFDDIVASTRALWDAVLETVTVEADTPTQALIASDLYRMFLFPNDASENRGSSAEPEWCYADVSTPPSRSHTDVATGCDVREGRISVNHGFWDTYRTVWPAFWLIAPERAADLFDGFTEQFRSAGWMPRWAAPGPVDAMVGTSSDIIAAEALASGAALHDAEAVFDAALRNASAASARPEVGRADALRAILVGYTSTQTPEGLSWTLESAINDFGVAVIADFLSRDSTHPRHAEFRAVARWMRARAADFVHVFDPDVRFFVGRQSDGQFRPREGFDPRIWGGDYTETNAWGMRFATPHDGEALACLLGGKSELEAELDAFFTTIETGSADVAGSYGCVIHEMPEARNVRLGMFGLSNQPAHHIPYMYAFTYAPHKTGPIVRESVRRMFLGSEIGQGYPGDEDNGEMSAWHLLSSIGLYPLTPGTGEFLLIAPSVSFSRIRVSGDRVTTIRASELSPSHTYIRAVYVDGLPWTRATIPTAVLRRGVKVDIVLDDNPHTWWQEPPFSLTPPGGRVSQLVDAVVSNAVITPARMLNLFDDTGAHCVVLSPGDRAEVTLPNPATIVMYTVTSATSGQGLGWRIWGHNTAGWQLLDEVSDQRFQWTAQTRPFEIEPTLPVSALRFEMVSGDLTARQIQFLQERQIPRPEDHTHPTDPPQQREA